jgi:hypothetical protein
MLRSHLGWRKQVKDVSTIWSSIRWAYRLDGALALQEEAKRFLRGAMTKRYDGGYQREHFRECRQGAFQAGTIISDSWH